VTKKAESISGQAVVVNEATVPANSFAEQFAEAMVTAMNRMTPLISPQADTNKFLARQSYSKDLPFFSGKPEEWPIFKADFERSTTDCGFSNSENMSRLRKCLKGDASRYVLSLMVSPDNVPTVMKKLEIRYGQPELIIAAMITKAKGIPKFKDDDLDQLINFGSAVQNVVATIHTLNRAGHMSNPQLLKEFEDKLPRQNMMQWLNWVDMDTSRTKDLVNFSLWLDKQTTLACQACPPSISTAEDFVTRRNNKEVFRPNQEQLKSPFHEDTFPTAAGLYVGDPQKCIFCGKHPYSADCNSAKKMTLDLKRDIVYRSGCCYRCLQSTHLARNCRESMICSVCGNGHPKPLCPNASSSTTSNEPEKKNELTKPTVLTSSTNLSCSSGVILKTLMIEIQGQKGCRKVRALLDDRAQRSYILKRTVDELGIQDIGKQELFHTVFGGVQSQLQHHTKYSARCKRVKGYGFHAIELLDQNRICGNLERMPYGSWMNQLKGKNIHLSDVGTGSPEIEVLLGTDSLVQIETGVSVRLGTDLRAVETIFGWAIQGVTPAKQHGIMTSQLSVSVSDMFVSDLSVEQLWSLETIGIRDPSESKSKEETEELTKEHFLKTVTREKDGRYTVSLPWTDGSQLIPSNCYIAQKRLEYTTSKLHATGMYQSYDALFKSWHEEGIIEEISKAGLDQRVHYLPHRAVIKLESLTTPIRPVFDASCKSGRNPSLNDCLEKGPNLLELIPSILLRFREKKIGIIGDIRKAFQTINVKESDRDFLRFLWWEDYNKKKYRIYRHRRVVFSVNCSTFLLGALLEFHLGKLNEEEKHIADKLLKSLYVDNVVSSEDSLEDCVLFKEYATSLLAEAKMELRSWEGGFVEKSKVDSLISRECGLDFGRPMTLGQTKPITSVLGYKWDKITDVLFVELTLEDLPRKITKRIILSYIQRIYDPIGFTSPVTLQPKALMQKLWKEKGGWEDEIVTELKMEFITWYEQLHDIKNIKIPRNMTNGNSDRKGWQIHTFTDASSVAYAGVVFLRTEVNQCVSVQLIAAKTRVAPLKKMTINRLELMGCYVGALLSHSVRKALRMDEGDLAVPMYYWTDSSTALAWILRNDEWGTFVGNRVKTICSLTNSNEWSHVPGVLNPADLPSRGCTASQLLESNWWEGPAWLRKSTSEWPNEELKINEQEVITEKRKSKPDATNILVVNTEPPWYASKSDLRKNVLIMAWVLRAVAVFKLKKAKNSEVATHFENSLSIEELKAAEETILRLLQIDSFPGEHNIISGLPVIMMKDEMWHVKTRLSNRQDKEGFRYPIIVPHFGFVVDQIIRNEHENSMHAGVQVVMGNLREKYWIIKGRRAVRRVLNRCVICRRYSQKKPYVTPAPLPEDRVKDAKVFEIVGVDLAGPLFMKGKQNKKAWIVLFTCAVYRCIHLELVKSLSTEAFMDAFSRFVAIRGRPAVVYSDNGTNFVGSSNALKELDWTKITKDHGLACIKWKFNPPATPWWGGWWERMVRMVKELLRRTLGRSKIGYEKLRTCVYEISAIINRRPLCVMTEDPEDLRPLTPSMFLQEMDSPSISDRELLEEHNFQNMCLYRKEFMDEIKVRFRREYLSQLVNRGKEKVVRELKVGDVALLGNDNKKRLEWILARVMEALPGKDGNVRLVRVKAAGKILLSPIQLLYPLEVSSYLENPIQDDKKDSESECRVPVDKNDELKVLRTRYGRQIKVPQRY